MTSQQYGSAQREQLSFATFLGCNNFVASFSIQSFASMQYLSTFFYLSVKPAIVVVCKVQTLAIQTAAGFHVFLSRCKGMHLDWKSGILACKYRLLACNGLQGSCKFVNEKINICVGVELKRSEFTRTL